eukprot:scaffold1922_cov291-Chaetoceros_neogracile.AAC.8
MMPLLVECDELPRIYDPMDSGDGDYEFVPLVALRRQRFGEEERSTWGPSNTKEDDAEDNYKEAPNEEDLLAFGTNAIVCKYNLPMGFLDTPFASQVLDRFPKKDYKGVPLPEEESPMFCYTTGCKLFRARYHKMHRCPKLRFYCEERTR